MFAAIACCAHQTALLLRLCCKPMLEASCSSPADQQAAPSVTYMTADAACAVTNMKLSQGPHRLDDHSWRAVLGALSLATGAAEAKTKVAYQESLGKGGSSTAASMSGWVPPLCVLS
jgi:hypothetical protein